MGKGEYGGKKREGEGRGGGPGAFYEFNDNLNTFRKAFMLEWINFKQC